MKEMDLNAPEANPEKGLYTKESAGILLVGKMSVFPVARGIEWLLEGKHIGPAMLIPFCSPSEPVHLSL